MQRYIGLDVLATGTTMAVVGPSGKRLSCEVRRISSANAAQLGVVRALEARRDAAARERDRLVDAIAMGIGSSRALVAEVEKREVEVAALDARIAEVAAQLHPCCFRALRRLQTT